MLIISQSGWAELVGACQSGVERPTGDLNCLFPSLTPLVLSPCPPDPASGTGYWVIQSSVSEVTPCRRAEGAEDTTLLFNLSLTPFLLVSRTKIGVKREGMLLPLSSFHSCAQMV